MREIKSNKKSFLTKLFIKLCRLFGFEIIDQSNYSIPTSNQDLNQSISIPGERSVTLPLGKVKITRPVKSLDIILRTCMSVNMLTQSKRRIFEKNKDEYTKRTLFSIIKSVHHAQNIFKNLKFKIFIIDHNSEKNQIQSLKNMLHNSKINFEILNLEVEKFSNQIKKINEENKEVTLNQKSNMSNIYQSLLISKEKSKDLIYFVEDDYIHKTEALAEMVFAYEKFSSIFNKELFILSTDYPYLYKKFENSNILIGENYHWRTVKESLLTFLTSNQMLNKYQEKLKEMAKNESNPFEKNLHEIFDKELCLSPLPSLSIHCSNVNSVFGLSPNIDIKKLWDENKF